MVVTVDNCVKKCFNSCMEQTKIEIKILKNDCNKILDKQDIESSFFAESNKSSVLNQITLSGRYNCVYTIATSYFDLTEKRVILDDNLLFICLISKIVVIDLTKETLLHTIDMGRCWLYQICKFKSGYFLHGELNNYFLDKSFYVVWEESCCDIFFNSKVEKDLEIFENYIVAWDWYGWKHYYNESGEFKTECYPEYSMSD